MRVVLAVFVLLGATVTYNQPAARASLELAYPSPVRLLK
jgi:hypothetical protein